MTIIFGGGNFAMEKKRLIENWWINYISKKSKLLNFLFEILNFFVLMVMVAPQAFLNL